MRATPGGVTGGEACSRVIRANETADEGVPGRAYDVGVPLLAIGVSHHDVGSEQLATLGAQADSLVNNIRESGCAISGLVALTTCNRFEVYLESGEFHSGVEAALTAFATHGVDPKVLAAVHVFADSGAVEHLFDVACGLDSMVVGEAEIHGQVRAALAAADAAGTSGPTLHRLFQDALATAKAVASQTTLGAAGRSIASVGLDLVERRHGPVAGRRALVLGTGAYAGVVVATLARRGCTDLSVHSQTGRATAFAASHPGVRAIAADGLEAELRHTDLVVSASGAGEHVLTPDTLGERRSDAAVGVREARGLPILDLRARGDVPAEVAAFVDVDVIGLDEIGAHAPAAHTDAILAARDLVARAVTAYQHVEQGRTAAPAVTAMRAHVMSLIEAEIELARRRYPDETAEAVARALHRVSGALLHTPSVRAVELARTGGLDDYRRAMHTLFGIEVS